MFTPEYINSKFTGGLMYEAYLKSGTPDQFEAWTKIYNQVKLTDAQRNLISGFTREMHVICISGIWCGDCVQQGPLLQRIAEVKPEIVKLVWLDRDEHMDMAQQITINAGTRVPVVIFAAEDNEQVAIYGDRTLSRYRAIAQRQLGPSCPLPGAPVADEELAATMQDWLNEFERVQLLLRTSARLRQLHGD